MRLRDEPSTTEVRGLVLSVDYDRNPAGWSATLRHARLGAVTSHGSSPSKAREAARERIADQLESMMQGHSQKHAHEVQ
jgi:pyridoxine/pyridoxamine 5'-phosphate oxidase